MQFDVTLTQSYVVFQNGPVYRWHLNGVDRWRGEFLDLVAVFKFYRHPAILQQKQQQFTVVNWATGFSPGAHDSDKPPTWTFLGVRRAFLRGRLMPHSHRLLIFTISSTKELKSRCWLSTCTLAYWLRNVLFSSGPVAVVVLSLFTSRAWDNIITFDITRVKKAIKSLLHLSPNVSFAPSFLHFCPDFHPPSYSLTSYFLVDLISLFLIFIYHLYM